MHCASAALNMAISIDQYAQQNFATTTAIDMEPYMHAAA